MPPDWTAVESHMTAMRRRAWGSRAETWCLGQCACLDKAMHVAHRNCYDMLKGKYCELCFMCECVGSEGSLLVIFLRVMSTALSVSGHAG